MAALFSALEKLASYVPGYTGYAEKEKRRETDQALRRAVGKRLSDLVPSIDSVISESARTMRFEALEPLERVKRRLTRLADSIRHAPAGASGLFDAQKADVALLDRLLAHDTELRDAVEGLATAVEAATSAGTDGRDLERSVTLVENAVRSREEILRGVE